MAKLDYIAEIVKPPGERHPFTVGYAGRLPSGATVVSSTLAGFNHFTGAADNSVLASTTGTVSGNNVSLVVYGGTAKQEYDIIVTTTLSDSSILVDYLFLSVQIPRAMR